MNKLTQRERIFEFLKQNPLKQFKPREVALGIVEKFPEYYKEKRKNPRFKTESDFINQIVAEIAKQKDDILRTSPNIQLQNKPRLFWYDPNTQNDVTTINSDSFESEIDIIEDLETTYINTKKVQLLSEDELYPLLIEFLKSELGLYCLRIDEKRSANTRGLNGNQWLHPDIVAMQPLDKGWHEFIKTCVKHSSGQNVRLWSFEVKKELNSSNIRSSFFQAVSNSSWAHEGYLVATAISKADVEEELRMLSALHGIGVILLNTDNPTESEILLPSRRRHDADWQTINRILKENTDFKQFIDLVANYFQSGRIYQENWNK
ncbi:HrgA protein [Acinetobacter ursingii]|uniref:HrgA protein n=1 Tax=Acinetobacter ursingii TaxID=108980 RepID=A0AA46S4X6_9GAMM|nr:HrgA protein [Acinetobacter ursingii]MCU4488527.1 HrgA protein [Acinetobacter ursingii]MCU4604604.1 HrgA protein [Acinetobacter ursingii]MDA3577976.1 HrgA protein [Acinetobacter ursingii]MDH0807595.1 HrgA protein [Acinetobacter ursingii]MDH2074661.1 HrgA protein [Acinetobacter ursingii]